MSITPRILYGPHGDAPQTKQELITCSGSAAIAIGSFVTTAGAAMASGATDAAYIVDAILLADGLTPKRNGYLNATEAAAAAHKLRVIPLGGLILEMEEDGDGGNISLTETFATNKYAEAIVTAPADITEDEKSDTPQVAHANIKIDSSDLNSSATGRLLEILGCQSVQNSIAAVTSSTITSPAWSTGIGRLFRVRVVPALSPPDNGTV